MKYIILAILSLGITQAHADSITKALKKSIAEKCGDADCSGTPVQVPFQNVIVFGCENFANVRYLLNTKLNKTCHIANPTDANTIEQNVPGGPFFGIATIFFQKCPDAIKNVNDCSMTALRNF